MAHFGDKPQRHGSSGWIEPDSRKQESDSSPSPAHDLVTDPDPSPHGLSTPQSTLLHLGVRENSYKVREK